MSELNKNINNSEFSYDENRSNIKISFERITFSLVTTDAEVSSQLVSIPSTIIKNSFAISVITVV